MSFWCLRKGTFMWPCKYTTTKIILYDLLHKICSFYVYDHWTDVLVHVVDPNLLVLRLWRCFYLGLVVFRTFFCRSIFGFISWINHPKCLFSFKKGKLFFMLTKISLSNWFMIIVQYLSWVVLCMCKIYDCIVPLNLRALNISWN